MAGVSTFPLDPGKAGLVPSPSAQKRFYGRQATTTKHDERKPCRGRRFWPVDEDGDRAVVLHGNGHGAHREESGSAVAVVVPEAADAANAANAANAVVVANAAPTVAVANAAPTAAAAAAAAGNWQPGDLLRGDRYRRWLSAVPGTLRDITRVFRGRGRMSEMPVRVCDQAAGHAPFPVCWSCQDRYFQT